MAFFERFFGAPSPAPPVLLRVRTSSGALPETVRLELRWSSGHHESKAVIAAQGLCMLPWRESERYVHIEIHALGQTSELRISAGDNRRSTAREILLGTELCAE